MTATSSRPVSMVSHIFNLNLVIDVRPAGAGACAHRSGT